MNTTEATPAPAIGGRQVDQLLGGRYRLAMSKGGDDVADVWHALDETTQQVVTLEILRDRGNDAARQRFLAEARRMAAIERPSVMRVASIIDEGTDTFIVFEHLIPLPVVLTGLTAVARDVRPATKAAEDKDKTVVLLPAAPQAPAPVAADETAPTIAALDDAREPSVPHLGAATTRLPDLLADARGFVRDVMSDVQMDKLIADARAFISDARARVAARFDTARPKKADAPQAGVGADVDASLPNVAVTKVALPDVMSLVPGVTALVARARGNRLALAGSALLLLAVVVVVSPLDDAIGSALRGGPAPSPTPAPGAALVPAPFVVPPLGAYGATFESQGPYPTTTPNGTVEWVVALRNTGSAGWHRGIEGAQAALMTTDGAGVAVQSTEYVAPGQVGWFVVRFKARAETGTYTVHLLPRIDGRGLLPELGIYTVVTVAKNP